MYLLAVVAGESPETVRANSSQTRTALHVGMPLTCEEGLETKCGPPVKVTGPLTSVRTPLGGVSAPKARTASEMPAPQRARLNNPRRLERPDWAGEFFRIMTP